jgi:hypothetical protein
MNTKTILAVSMAAVLTMVIAFPVVAEAISPLKKSNVDYDEDVAYEEIHFLTQSKVNNEIDVFGGYAIFTEGHVVAVTSHAGFFDSTAQDPPALTPLIQFAGPAAVCNPADTGCGAEWHSHVVVPDTTSPYCNFASIAELTYEEPSERIVIGGPNIHLKNTDIGTNSFTQALAGGPGDFMVGNPTGASAHFNLYPAVMPAGLKAVCITDVSTDPGDLCTDITTAGSGSDYRDAAGTGGSHDEVELSEFAYSENLFNAINTTTGDFTPEGLDATELQTWFDANCVAP